MLARAENGRLAEVLRADTVRKQQIEREQLTIHSDRGSPMTAKPVAFLLADLGVTKSFSRPHVSINPYSESQFRTMKYRPEFPERFGCYEDAQGFCSSFFGWYNDGPPSLGDWLPHPPANVHYGRAEAVRKRRTHVLDAAYAEHPERFVRKRPEPPTLPSAAWINEPKEVLATTQ